MVLKSVREKARIWFNSSADEDLYLLQIQDKSPSEVTEGTMLRGGGEQQIMNDPDHDVLRKEVMTNREMVNNIRIRISQIDERTAFMSKVLFGLLIAVVGGVAVGLILAFVGIGV